MAQTAEQKAILKGMDTAAEELREELNLQLDGMSPEEVNGALAVCFWMKEGFIRAGYKRMSRIMIDVAKANS